MTTPRHTGKCGLLRVVADQLDALGLVLDDVRSNRWVVRYLLDKERGLAAVVLVGPFAVEESI